MTPVFDIFYSIGFPFNPLGTGDLTFYQSQGLHTFSGLSFFLLNQSFICHGSQFSSLFTIFQEHVFP